MRSRHLIATALLLCLALPAAARYARVDTQEVPIARLIANLEEQLPGAQGDPAATARLKLNLGRLHAMAWALASDVATVRSGSRTPWHGYEPAAIPWGEVRQQEQQEPAPARGDAQHLKDAVRLHREALEAAPKDPLARLGLGWCLLVSGDKPAAVEVLRPLAEEAWAEDQKLDSLHGYAPTLSEEVGHYLIQALDPQRDAAEIARLKERKAKLEALPRAVTPLAIPLRAGLGPEALLDPGARVRFAVDGQSPHATWTWITPHAGWLVLLPRDGSRAVRSGLQLVGSVSWWLFWADGYQALRALDDDGDGQLRGPELEGLGVWQDRDRDGVSDPGEVETLEEAGVEALSCRSEPHAHPDVQRWSAAGVTLRGGEVRPTFDLLLRRAR